MRPFRPPRRSVSPAQRAAVRLGAVAALAASIAVPLARRRRRIPATATLACLVAGPLAVAVLRPRTRGRDIVLFTLQMWGFTMAHELPYDDPEALRRRLKIRYPIVVDRLIGGGTLPNIRLQRALSAPGRVTVLDRVLSMIHWVWFMEPHAALLFVQARHPERFPSAARQLAATYDLGCAIYFAVPTAPPWWSAEQGHIEAPVEHVAAEVAEHDAAVRRSEAKPSRAAVEAPYVRRRSEAKPSRAVVEAPYVRRIMVDAGEEIWRRAWDPLYESFNSNPWAAMPSLHFATSLMAAIHLAEAGRMPGALGWGYATALAFALVYLGEHYVTDLVAGAALVVLVRRGEPIAEPAVEAVNGLLRRLERVAT